MAAWASSGSEKCGIMKMAAGLASANGGQRIKADKENQERDERDGTNPAG